MNIETLRALALALKEGKTNLPPLRRGESFHMTYTGKVVGKERPRKGGNGHFYTPKETKEFEAKVKDAAKKAMLGKLVMRCSVMVHLTIIDQVPANTPKWLRQLMLNGVVHSHNGADLDNREKAVLDALNGIVYIDDRQVVQVYKFRRYEMGNEGFTLDITGVGLTVNDVENVKRILDASR